MLTKSAPQIAYNISSKSEYCSIYCWCIWIDIKLFKCVYKQEIKHKWADVLKTTELDTKWEMILSRICYYLSLPSYTLLTKPHSLASEAIIFLAVKTSSRTRLSLPITRGNLCKVPTSAASPVWKHNYTTHSTVIFQVKK